MIISRYLLLLQADGTVGYKEQTMLTKEMEYKYRAIDSQGHYIGDRLYQESPNHIEAPKPKFGKETQRAKWNGKKWLIEDIEETDGTT